jgi:hypothetical protein
LLISKILFFYQNVLGIDIILYDFEYIENDLEYRKWFKQKRLEEEPLINGDVTIELVQLKNKNLRIYENRFWGDCGLYTSALMF